MSVHLSTKFCNAAIQNVVKTSPAAIFTTMQLRLFSGTAPATADALETGTLLLVLTGDFVDATTYNALTWLDTAAALGVLLKSTQVWAGKVGDTNAGVGSSATTKITTGTAVATWGRFCSKADTGVLDTTYVWPRIQGDIAAAGLEIDLSSTTLSFGATITANYAALSMTPS